uniref:EamA domain-containing protein n=1 Tax=Glossina brevipalpis TaxID=37001 RepID=A0A1A9WCU2_9MUSC
MFFLRKYRLCFLAGFYAAGGSFFGKMPSILTKQNIFRIRLPVVREIYSCYCEFGLFHCVPFLLMILCNLLNWRYFIKALQISEQTLFTTVLTTATNYVVSFILGAFIYREPITFLSILGASLILIGLLFLCHEPKNFNDNKAKIK